MVTLYNMIRFLLFLFPYSEFRLVKIQGLRGTFSEMVLELRADFQWSSQENIE